MFNEFGIVEECTSIKLSAKVDVFPAEKQMLVAKITTAFEDTKSAYLDSIAMLKNPTVSLVSRLSTIHLKHLRNSKEIVGVCKNEKEPTYVGRMDRELHPERDRQLQG